MSDEARADAEPVGEELEPREALQELLEEIAGALGIDVEVEVEERAGELNGRIKGGEVGLFIGRHGQTIDAVQHLAQRIVFPDGPGELRVDDAAEEALRTGRAVEFDPLPSWERRVVHEYLRDRAEVQTHSEGDEPERYVVVSPAEG
jgi:spoIIIJ-associated protein